MALDLPFSNRSLSNLVYIFDQTLNLDPSNLEKSDVIILDATTNYSKVVSGTITSNPVGDKTDRSDHYRLEPEELQIDGVISNNPLDLFPWLRQTFSDEESRSIKFINDLEKIFNNKSLVTVYMPDGLSTEDCLITNLSISRDPQWSNGFRISITARKVKVLTEEISTVSRPSEADKTDGKSNKGNSSAKSEKVSRNTSEASGQPVVKSAGLDVPNQELSAGVPNAATTQATKGINLN